MFEEAEVRRDLVNLIVPHQGGLVATGERQEPFRLDRSRRGGRAHAHHNPVDRYRDERAGLLSAVQGGVHPGRGVIAVTRKGTRRVQELPASPDAFVWLRLYQAETGGRSAAAAGVPVTLHALRHTALPTS